MYNYLYLLANSVQNFVEPSAASGFERITQTVHHEPHLNDKSTT